MSTQELIAIAVPTIIPTLAILLSIFRSDSSIDKLRGEMKAEIHTLRSEIHTEINTLRSEIHTEINNLRADLHADIRILNSLA